MAEYRETESPKGYSKILKALDSFKEAAFLAKFAQKHPELTPAELELQRELAAVAEGTHDLLCELQAKYRHEILGTPKLKRTK